MPAGSANHIRPLPTTVVECKERGWDELDIVLVSGDAYIDHPAFGIGLIGRLLENKGYRIAILPQPSYGDESDFLRFGRPRLFFGVSAGNVDSIVANYSGNRKVRDFDAFSPGGSPWRSGEHSKLNRYRPDRAVLIYANLARRAYPDVPVIIGGIEASLRRFTHFDYKQNKLRGSHLTDSKADLLVYGMAENAIVEAAEKLKHNLPLDGLQGTCIRVNNSVIEEYRKRAIDKKIKLIELPSYQSILNDPTLFLKAEKEIDRHARGQGQSILVQQQQSGWIIQFPPAAPLTTRQLDHLYTLPFSRRPHPCTPDVPAFRMIQNSVTIVRGCSGNCSFCAISRHQGPMTTSRSITSIISEVDTIASSTDFNGTISDLGGPTANLFGTHCAIGSCRRHDCLYPKVCKNLIIEEDLFIQLLEKVLNIPGVHHTYISSGLRMELLNKTPRLMRKLIKDHIPGSMKIAPEHTEDDVLTLMHKEPHEQLIRFLKTFRDICRELKCSTSITPYIISAHPGCTFEHTLRMVNRLKKLGVTIRQFQDFTPTPGTLSTAMYVSGLHRDSEKPITVPRNQSERLKQRTVIEEKFFQKKKNRGGSSRSKTGRNPLKKRH